MRLSWNEIQHRAVQFAKNWKDAKDEKAQAQLFLNDFFHVFGVDLKRVALFEKKVPMGEKRDGYIDCLWRGTILIEMKSRGKSLNKAYKQAHDYAFNLTDEELPEYIMVCDFENIKLYRLTTDQVWTFKAANLHKHVRKFALLAGYKSAVSEEPTQIAVNEEAAKKMAKLHDKLKESGYDGHALEVYLIRLLYCMFADDSRIFEEGSFTKYIKESKVDGSDLSRRIAELFEILDMDENKRQKNTLLPEEMKRNFPYINGKLFRDPLPMAYFDSSMREILLECCGMDWSKISPAIFGAMFQEVTDQKKRRELGAHYTSEENILKVIKPLFLDDLREEFELIKHDKRKLTDVAISESVSFIGELAFTFCSCLASITVKQSNQNYKSENGVLFDKSGTRLIQYPCGKSGEYTISSSVKSIDGYAFTACLGVTSINVDLNNPNYKSKDGVLFNKDGSTLIQYPSGKIERSYIVPDFASIINYYSFCHCDKLRSVVIPATVTSIKYGAFEWHNLASLYYEGLVNPGNFDAFGRRTVPEVYVPWNYKDDNFCGLSVPRSPAPSQTPMYSKSPVPTLTPTQTQDSTTTVGFEKWFIDNAAWMVPAFSIAVSAIGLLLKSDKVKNFCLSHCCHKESETTETGTLDEKLL